MFSENVVVETKEGMEKENTFDSKDAHNRTVSRVRVKMFQKESVRMWGTQFIRSCGEKTAGGPKARNIFERGLLLLKCVSSINHRVILSVKTFAITVLGKRIFG